MPTQEVVPDTPWGYRPILKMRTLEWDFANVAEASAFNVKRADQTNVKPWILLYVRMYSSIDSINSLW